MGAVVDDKAVNELLVMLTTNVSDPQGLIENAILRTGRGMNQAVLIDVLRQQLLAMRLLQLGHQFDQWAGYSSTPGERWSYFKRVRQEATIEVAMLSPKDFTKEVKEPSNKELEEFFDKYKNVEASPDSPEPGFRVPRRVNVEYLEADEGMLIDQITDAEVSEEYNKDPSLYAHEKEDAEREEKQEKEAREKEDKEEAAAKAAAEKKSGSDAKKIESQPAVKPEAKPAAKPGNNVEVKPQHNPPANPAAKPDVKSGTNPDALKPGAPAKPATTAAKPTGSSSLTPRSPFRLVAYTAENAANSADNSHQAAVAGPKSTAAGSSAQPAPDGAKPSEAKHPAVGANLQEQARLRQPSNLPKNPRQRLRRAPPRSPIASRSRPWTSDSTNPYARAWPPRDLMKTWRQSRRSWRRFAMIGSAPRMEKSRPLPISRHLPSSTT